MNDEEERVTKVESRIDAHEEVCALRYKILDEKFDVLFKAVKDINSKIMSALIALLVIVLGATAYLYQRYEWQHQEVQHKHEKQHER